MLYKIAYKILFHMWCRQEEMFLQFRSGLPLMFLHVHIMQVSFYPSKLNENVIPLCVQLMWLTNESENSHPMR